jgi:fimbrial isopeptide formation D2 family protein
MIHHYKTILHAKKTLLSLFFAFSACISLSAQDYVTIPDSNFVKYLNITYPTCMNGNQLDTTCNLITMANEVTIDGQFSGAIADLTGIQYFKDLKRLYLIEIQVEKIPALPPRLEELLCNDNKLKALPAFPESLYRCVCSNNQITSIGNIPPTSKLQIFDCSGNKLTHLPNLPPSLLNFKCNKNELLDLPPLNKLTGVTELNCSDNQLTQLPALPPNIYAIWCANNLLISLPAIPENVEELDCSNNRIVCFPVLPYNCIVGLTKNLNTCVANFTKNMDTMSVKFPLCEIADGQNNPNGCSPKQVIKGNVYNDINGNCKKDSAEIGISNFPVKLFDNLNNLLAQTTSNSSGTYQFLISAGSYKIVTDTAGTPFEIKCKYPGNDSAVTLSTTVSEITNINFPLSCKPGFDAAVQSVTTSGIIFPGRQHQLNGIAGSMAKLYNANCAPGAGGQVRISVDGPVSYVGTAAGALTPVISGKTFTYTIPDFGSINNQKAFGLLLKVDTTAQAGNAVCVGIKISSAVADKNSLNDTLFYCYPIVNSLDPNEKNVFPLDVVNEGYNEWFNYTIHFQNTGNAPAMDIRLVDTLDKNLDLKTFQVVEASHQNQFSIVNNKLTFKFADIQLADSASNPEGSKGFVHYRIKPKSNLLAGNTISNRAAIYFDYNAPVMTNTTVNHYTKTVAVNEQKPVEAAIYPNPGKDLFYLELGDNSTLHPLIEVYNVLGKMVWTARVSQKRTTMDLSGLPNGVYLLKIEGIREPLIQRIIKQ